MPTPPRLAVAAAVAAAAAAGLAGGVVQTSRADHIEGTSCGGSQSCAGHQFWPRMTPSDVQKARENAGTTLRGKPGNDDELLGWHGSDKLYGGEGSDVLWGDHIAARQPTNQKDFVSGGPGNDFIYTSRGVSTVLGGQGNDAIKARYGRGSVDCGSGKDIVHVPKSRKRNWKFRNCEKFESRTEAQVGRGLKPLS